MSEQVGFTLRGRNPDVLTCIANLSNDEVFTPPEFANRMLDTLTVARGGQSRWREPLGRQDSQVPRSLHQVGRVPA
jgi:site-specific DNA-methyltransferase (adenine-specific)